MPPRKILVLHGYSQNAIVFSKRLGALRKSVGKDIEFVFVDAPHILLPADLAGLSSTPATLDAPEVAVSKPTDPSETMRGWWRHNAARTKSEGVEVSLQLMKELLMKDQYEAVFGFSQGAAMAALLSALLERPHLHPPFLVDGKSPHPPMKFCIAACGFKLLDPAWAEIFMPSYSTPTLHVIGTNDVIVTSERSQSLLDMSASKRVVKHDGGHFVPSKASWRNFFRDYLQDPFGDVPAPPFGTDGGESVPSSVPASGTVTPAEREARVAMATAEAAAKKMGAEPEPGSDPSKGGTPPGRL